MTFYIKSDQELTEQDVQRIIATFTSSTTGVRNSVLLTVMWRTGLKVQEALNLTVENVDFENNRLNVGRPVHIETLMLGYLSRWLEMRPPHTNVVFCTTGAKKMSQRSVRTIMSKAALRAGIDKPAYPTALRRLFAIDMERAGKKLSEIADLMGHKSTRTTAAYLS